MDCVEEPLNIAFTSQSQRYQENNFPGDSGGTILNFRVKPENLICPVPQKPILDYSQGQEGCLYRSPVNEALIVNIDRAQRLIYFPGQWQPLTFAQFHREFRPDLMDLVVDTRPIDWYSINLLMDGESSWVLVCKIRGDGGQQPFWDILTEIMKEFQPGETGNFWYQIEFYPASFSE